MGRQAFFNGRSSWGPLLQTKKPWYSFGMLIAIGLGAVVGHVVARNAMRRGLGQLPPVHVGMGAFNPLVDSTNRVLNATTSALTGRAPANASTPLYVPRLSAQQYQTKMKPIRGANYAYSPANPCPPGWTPWGNLNRGGWVGGCCPPPDPHGLPQPCTAFAPTPPQPSTPPQLFPHPIG